MLWDRGSHLFAPISNFPMKSDGESRVAACGQDASEKGSRCASGRPPVLTERHGTKTRRPQRPQPRPAGEGEGDPSAWARATNRQTFSAFVSPHGWCLFVFRLKHQTRQGGHQFEKHPRRKTGMDLSAVIRTSGCLDHLLCGVWIARRGLALDPAMFEPQPNRGNLPPFPKNNTWIHISTYAQMGVFYTFLHETLEATKKRKPPCISCPQIPR